MIVASRVNQANRFFLFSYQDAVIVMNLKIVLSVQGNPNVGLITGVDDQLDLTITIDNQRPVAESMRTNRYLST